MKISKMMVLMVVGFIFFFLVLTHTDAIASEEEIVEGNTAFALDLYKQLSHEADNLFFSPYSLSTALAMTYAGARGDTETQMAKTLHFSLPQDSLHPAFASLTEHVKAIESKGDVALNVANALWIQQDFELLDTFLQSLETYYDAQPFQVNFKQAYEDVRNKINQWVEKQTQAKIKNLLAPGTLNDLTRLVLTNAIYFKGNWTTQFDKKLTQEEPFWMTPNQEITVSMMHQTAGFKYGETEYVQVLELPYAGEDLAMLMLLPKEKDGLFSLEQRLSVEKLRDWIAAPSYREVDVSIPKFTLTTQFTLSRTLSTMGMPDAFSAKADFSGMETSKQLSISEVIHKAFIDVNEEGTEAAAATAVVVGVTSVAEPQPIPVFKADHPFLFFILEKQTGSILFLGRIVNPSAK
jgi:serpin B